MHNEQHRSARIGWLRAAVLGANDGLISTSSLIVGVASASPARSAVLLAAIAGLVSGALSMAAGEYVSVSSQADTEGADLARERGELAASPEAEPFCKAGDRVSGDKTLCIIEAMKVMNEIKAEREFEILEILVKNGEPVEFGQPLFLIR